MITIYYFSEELTRGCEMYGTGRDDAFTTKEELIVSAEDFFGESLTEKEKSLIVSENIHDYDYYAVQGLVDGFGHDTATFAVFKTTEECENYIAQNKREIEYKIIGQYWGEYNEYWG